MIILDQGIVRKMDSLVLASVLGLVLVPDMPNGLVRGCVVAIIFDHIDFYLAISHFRRP
jgi:hypothetical protein